MLLQLDMVVESFRSALGELGAFLPRFVGALVILAVGWIIARVIRTLVVKGLEAVKFDDLSKRSGVDEMLKQGDVPLTLKGVLAGLVYWIIMLITLIAAFNSLGLRAASDIFRPIVLYLPNVVVAVLILIFGALFAKLIRGILGTYLANAEIEGARLISGVAYWAVVIFAVFVAFEQLAIGQALLLAAFRIAFGAVCLALALAFGLGGRDWAARVIDRAFKK